MTRKDNTMAYSDELRTEMLADTKRRQDEKRIYTYKIFARHYVDLSQNGMEAARKTFPNLPNDTLVREQRNKLLKNPYVWKEIETVRAETLAAIELSIGRLAQERWKQYEKYKDNPKMWKAAESHLTGLEKLKPKEASIEDQSKLPAGGVNIYINRQLEVGASVRQPDYEQIQKDAPELFDMTKDEDAANDD